MTEETIYEGEETRSRRGLATYFRRLARRLSRGEPVPADEEQTVTVEMPADPEFEVELEQQDETMSLEIEVEWPAAEGTVDTDAHASKATFDLYEDNAEEWRWRLVHDNGNIIADSSQGYASKQKAKQGLESVRKNAPGAHVLDTSKDDEPEEDEGASKATFELFADAGAKWRWRLRHDNGEIIGDGGQGYSSKQKAKQGLRSVKTNVRGAEIR
jgi:amphi-Trp domain-containing protein